MMVLAGDIGGTKTWLAIAQSTENGVELICDQQYPSTEFDDLTPIINTFIAETNTSVDQLKAACFAVAGPVEEHQGRQHSEITNLPWNLDSERLKTELRVPKVGLINDFQGVGFGIQALKSDDLVSLQTGERVPHAPCAVIGAGTGLGNGILVWHQDHYQALPTEGGHVDFAPQDNEQIGLLRHLKSELGHVSVERLVSGSGLVRIFDYLQNSGAPAPSAALTQQLQNGDKAAAISACAPSDPAAQQAIDLFMKLYGAQAGNLALMSLARGGLYIAGGIAPKNLTAMMSGTFINAFLDKGRMRPVLEKISVQIVTNPQVGLLGAAIAATHL